MKNVRVIERILNFYAMLDKMHYSQMDNPQHEVKCMHILECREAAK
jgi:uncharacterized pyridoxamine 5'-phosphate oxidase family protein